MGKDLIRMTTRILKTDRITICAGILSGLIIIACLAWAAPVKAANEDSCAYIGEIQMSGANFAPLGWLVCWGQELKVAEFGHLFSVIGNTFGGDGITTFALPDLRGRVAVGAGQGTGLTNRPLGEKFGSEQATINDKSAGAQLTIAPTPTGHTGNSLETIAPVTVVNYIICYDGVFPEQWD